MSLEYVHVGLWDYQDNKVVLIDLENGRKMQNIEIKARTKFMTALDGVIIFYIHSIINENRDWMELLQFIKIEL